MQCARGCSSCCVDDLRVLPVEAEAIARHVEEHPITRVAPVGRCAFLDDDGACTVYDARPFLCRTHGLPLRTEADAEGGRVGLRVLRDDVSVCSLNFTTRAPVPREVLDAVRIQTLLVTVDRRFRVVAGMDDDVTRIPLRALAASLVEPG